MATFYSTSVDGSGVALFVSPPGSVPNNVTYRRDFDASTNAAVIADFNNSSQAFSFVGGTLVKNDVPVTFQPDGHYFEARQRAAALLQKLTAVKQGSASLSGEDLADAIAIAFHADGLPST